jgi:hypothetical protein
MSRTRGVVRHGGYRRVEAGDSAPTARPERKPTARRRERDPQASLSEALRRLRSAIDRGNVAQVHRLETRIDQIMDTLGRDGRGHS